jgi:hypothetical protein
MSQRTFHDADLAAWHDGRAPHPEPRLHGRMAALSWRRQGVAHGASPRRCGRPRGLSTAAVAPWGAAAQAGPRAVCCRAAAQVGVAP